MDAETGVKRRHRRWMIPAAGVALAVVVSIVLFSQVRGNASCTGSTATAAMAPPAVRWNAVALAGGKASYYSTDRNGACSLGAPATDAYAAVGRDEYAGGAACGSYLDVTGPNGTTRVQVVDLCPSCPVGKIDVSRAAFARIGALSAGIIPVSYVVARDPQLPGPLKVRLKGGSGYSALTVVVDHHGNPLSTVELQTPGGWVGLRRGSDNLWTAPSGAVAAPVTLRISDTGGHQALVTGLTLGSSAFQQTGTFMYGAPSPSAPAPTSGTVGLGS